MKKNYIYQFLLFAGILSTVFAEAQSMNGPAVAPRDLSAFQNVVNINGQDGFYLKKDLYEYSSYTVINGQKVLGVPFLYMDWQKGVLTTPDNRVYTDYGLKYNVENQTVSFINGKDSLEVNEEIKEFTLNVMKDDTLLEPARFVNANQFQKSNRVFYYEVVMENEKGILLRTNDKKVTTLGDGLLSNRSQQYLKLERAYFYYDKQKKKVIKIKSTSNTLPSLNISAEQIKAMQADQYDFANESDIIAFMVKFMGKDKKGF